MVADAATFGIQYRTDKQVICINEQPRQHDERSPLKVVSVKYPSDSKRYRKMQNHVQYKACAKT